MKSLLAVFLVAVFAFAGCVVVPGRHGHGHPGPGVVLVPPLPPIIVLEEPYYYHEGYHYHYRDHHWYYSKSRSGPWTELPRDRYPGKVKFKGKRWKHEREHDKDRGHEYED